jgi:hypothetical protein
MKALFLFMVCLILAVPALVVASDKKPKVATGDEDSIMQGRIFSGIEDLGSGYLDEALRKLEYANDDINKLEYSAHTRWMARYWYAKVLQEKRKIKKAAKVILLAQQDVQYISAEERDDTQKLADEIQAKRK